MSRYLIIDLSRLGEKNLSEINDIMVGIENTGLLLREEESMAKFKEVYDEGCQQGYAGNNWEDFKKTL